MGTVKNLKVGQSITSSNGEVLKIAKLSKGWLPNSTFIEYTNGSWSCVSNKLKIQF